MAGRVSIADIVIHVRIVHRDRAPGIGSAGQCDRKARGHEQLAGRMAHERAVAKHDELLWSLSIGGGCGRFAALRDNISEATGGASGRERQPPGKLPRGSLLSSASTPTVDFMVLMSVAALCAFALACYGWGRIAFELVHRGRA